MSEEELEYWLNFVINTPDDTEEFSDEEINKISKRTLCRF